MIEPEENSRGKAELLGPKPMPGADHCYRDGGPSAQHRQLQSEGGGVSIEVAAIAFTGLVGMVGYVVQARSAQKASQAQASLEREAAEREKAQKKAAKQLERVQLQMGEWVMPLLVENSAVHFGWFNMTKVCRPREQCSVIILSIFGVQ
jgi:hypothetical protein